MFDSDVSAHMQGKVVRFGKCWHGLVKTNAVKDTGTTQFKTFYNNVTIETRGGKTLPFPIVKAIAGTETYSNLDSKHGPFCIYRHPLSVMHDEDADGKDWSGYVVFDINDSDFPRYLIGFKTGYSFAFTPDDNGQGFLVTKTFNFGSSYLNVRKPLIVNADRFETDQGRVNFPADMSGTFHFSKDGRSIYAGKFPSPRRVVEEMEYINWLSPSVRAATMAGGLDVNGDINITATEITVAQPPADVVYSDSRDVVRYDNATVTVPQVGTCVDPNDELVVKRSINGTATPQAGYYSVISELDQYSIRRRKSYIHASVSDEGAVSYLSLLFEEESTVTGGGSVTVDGGVTLGTDQCGVRPDDKRVLSTQTSTIIASNTTGLQETKIELSGYGGTSTFTARYDSSSSSTFTRTTLDGTPSETNTQSDNGADTMTLDGVTVYSESDVTGTPVLNISRPNLPVLNCIVDDSNMFSARFIQYGDVVDGSKWAVIAVRLADYQSHDLRAIVVTVQKGTVKMVGGAATSDPLTYSCKVYIGKTFGRGIIDETIVNQDLVDETYLIRAYDPLDKKVSAVYPFPVAYQ